MKILSIDPGFGRCGVAVVDGENTTAELLYSDCIETSAKAEFTDRLLEIAGDISRLIDVYTPDAIALEELYFTNNAKTAIHVAEVRGMLLYIAASRSLPIFEFNPLSVKVALTGNGRATKDAVTFMVKKLISLPAKKRLDDEYDAIALGLAALAESRHRTVRK